MSVGKKKKIERQFVHLSLFFLSVITQSNNQMVKMTNPI